MRRGIALLINSSLLCAWSLCTLRAECASASGPQQPGYVLDATSHQAIARATVNVVGNLALKAETTDDHGFFKLRLVESVKPGQALRVRIEKDGYLPFDDTIVVSDEKPPQLFMIRKQQNPKARRPLDKQKDKPPAAATEDEGFSANFSNDSEDMVVTAGNMTTTMSADQLKGLVWELGHGSITVLWAFGSTVKMYAEGDRLFADVTIMENGQPLIELAHNVLRKSPYQWDSNHSDRALEVVSDKGVPFFQMIFQTPHHIVIYGVFPKGDMSGSGLLLSESGTRNDPISVYDQRRLFKYPSWRYPGQYDDLHSSGVCPSGPALNDPLLGSTNADVADWALEEAALIKGMSDQCMNHLMATKQKNYAGPAPRAIRFDFLREVRKCCIGRVQELHESIIDRMPSLADPERTTMYQISDGDLQLGGCRQFDNLIEHLTEMGQQLGKCATVTSTTPR